MNESEARSLVHDLAAAFPNPPVGPETVAIYVRYLSELPNYETAAQGVSALTRRVTSLPAIAAVREAYTNAEQGENPDPELLLALAERVAEILEREGVEIVGASAR